MINLQTPALFVGHGNPMNAIEDNQFSRTWQKIGKSVPKNIKGVIIISAHWLTNGTKITNFKNNPLIYDMYGFPEELYHVDYPSQGNHELAETLKCALKSSQISKSVELDDSWGLDHGSWSVLVHLLPNPKVPIVQVSLDITLSLAETYHLFKSLVPFRSEGYLIIGSGNLVHNLRLLNFRDNEIYPWAIQLDQYLTNAINQRNLEQLLDPIKHEESAKIGIANDDHYRPFIATLSVIEEAESIEYFNDKFELGSLSMRSFITK